MRKSVPTYDIRDRLITYLKRVNISIAKLEKMCGFSKHYIAKAQFKLPAYKIDVILQVLPSLNRDWLLEGKGTMSTDSTWVPIAGQQISREEWKKQIVQRLQYILSLQKKSLQPYLNKMPGMDAKIYNVALAELIELWDLAYMILMDFPQFSPTWVIYGEGLITRNNEKYVPFVRIEEIPTVFNNITFFFKSTSFPSADFVTIQDQDVRQCEIFANDILSCRKLSINCNAKFSPNAPYLIVLKDGMRCIKFINWIENNGKDMLRLYEKDRYGRQKDFIDRELSDIIFIAQIVGISRSL